MRSDNGDPSRNATMGAVDRRRRHKLAPPMRSPSGESCRTFAALSFIATTARDTCCPKSFMRSRKDAKGKVDVAAVRSPVADFFAAKEDPALVVAAISGDVEARVPMTFDIGSRRSVRPLAV